MGARCLGVVLLLCLFLFPALAMPAQAGEWERYDFGAQGGGYAWRYLPTSALGTTDPLPVVVFFHGSGSNPEDWKPFLAPVAEATDVVVIAPKSDEFLTFHPGVDDVTIQLALERLGQEITVDPARLSLAGHSAGGGHAMVMAYGRRMGVNAVFVLGSPYRTVLDLADPDLTPPIRMYYGTADPNYSSARVALEDQWQKLAVPWEEVIGIGYGHSDWPADTLENGFRFLTAHPYATAGGCFPDATTLCLRGGDYAVSATWTDFEGHQGVAHPASARTSQSGLLTFFSTTNWELQIKVLNGCGLNSHRWVFAAGTTNVGFALRVEEMATGEVWTFDNPLGTAPEPILDIEAFPCD